MAKFWCINCQDEVEHRADYCHSRCGNDCEQVCNRCQKRTLTTTLSNPQDSPEAAIRQATGEAQRQARLTGKTGNIEVSMMRLDANTGNYQYHVLVYNTITKIATITRPL